MALYQHNYNLYWPFRSHEKKYSKSSFKKYTLPPSIKVGDNISSDFFINDIEF